MIERVSKALTRRFRANIEFDLWIGVLSATISNSKLVVILVVTSKASDSKALAQRFIAFCVQPVSSKVT